MKKHWLQYSYEFSGLFYWGRGTNCRMVLDMREIACTYKNPDLIVIMMNPGGSKPEDENNKFGNLQNAKFVPTQPDLTQWKVIDFMRGHGYKYARVLNLSDLCETESGKLKADKFRENSNFLLPPDRDDRFGKFFIENADLLIAWGSKEITKSAIVSALKVVVNKNCRKVYGYQNPKKDKIFFYHPLKRMPRGQKYDINHWLRGVKLLNKSTLKQLFHTATV